MMASPGVRAGSFRYPNVRMGARKRCSRSHAPSFLVDGFGIAVCKAVSTVLRCACRNLRRRCGSSRCICNLYDDTPRVVLLPALGPLCWDAGDFGLVSIVAFGMPVQSGSSRARINFSDSVFTAVYLGEAACHPPRSSSLPAPI